VTKQEWERVAKWCDEAAAKRSGQGLIGQGRVFERAALACRAFAGEPKARWCLLRNEVAVLTSSGHRHEFEDDDCEGRVVRLYVAPEAP